MRAIVGINLLGAAVLVLVSVVAVAWQGTDEKVCLDKAKVSEILALDYRQATIRLADGRTTEVYQATLKPGDDICLKWGRKPS